jgi:NAD(P)-dependent dehydrogenase (short-subunit alcohol dehydrogenase family)
MSEKMSKTLRTSAQEWRRVLSVNLDGTFNLILAIAPAMAARRSGRIINVSACLGRFTGPGLAGGLAPYRISKSAVNALTKNLAAELGNGTRGVLVDAMCPNHTRTDMGGPDAPRSAEEGAETIVWLATREHTADTVTGLLWEDRQIVPW